jgi:hypothetical protein
MATSFSGGGSRSTQREPPIMGKQLVNFITCGCESSAPFFVILYKLLGNTNINVSINELLSNTHCYTLLFQTTSYKKSYYGQHNLFTVIKMAREWYVGYLLNTRREDGFIC